MFKKSDKKIKENDQESNAAFEEFFNQVLKKMPARSAKIISSSLTVSKAKAEQFLAISRLVFPLRSVKTRNFCISLGTVSYTHLDVYKRQAQPHHL